MADTETFDFATRLDAVMVGSPLFRLTCVNEEKAREAIKALVAGKTVVLTANGEEIGRYKPWITGAEAPITQSEG